MSSSEKGQRRGYKCSLCGSNDHNKRACPITTLQNLSQMLKPEKTATKQKRGRYACGHCKNL